MPNTTSSLDCAYSNTKFGPWHNKEQHWAQTVKWLTHIDHIRKIPLTLDEYTALTKIDRDRHKDTGGYILGTLKGETRRHDDVLMRSGLALDIDKVDMTWDEIVDLVYKVLGPGTSHTTGFGYHTDDNDVAPIKPNGGYEYLLYPSISHGMHDKSCARIVIPFNHEIDAVQYAPIARMVMSWLGIDLFDTTAAQANRFFYMPAKLSDTTWTPVHSQGTFMDAHSVAKLSYSDWKDVSEWPASTEEKKLPNAIRNLKRGSHEKTRPEEMPVGIPGAACRAFTMYEALNEFLSDVWEPGSEEDRFTLLGSTSTNGGVVLDSVFLYSHHDSDAYKNRAHNVFDAVRRYRFGHLDVEAAQRASDEQYAFSDEDVVDSTEGKSFSQYPSFAAAKAFFENDERVVKQLMDDTELEIDEEMDAFADIGARESAGVGDDTDQEDERISTDTSYDDDDDAFCLSEGESAGNGMSSDVSGDDPFGLDAFNTLRHKRSDYTGPGRTSWRTGPSLPNAIFDTHGRKKSHLNTAIWALHDAPGIRGRIRFNETLGAPVWIESFSVRGKRRAEMIDITVDDPFNGVPVEENDLVQITSYLTARYQIEFYPSHVHDAVMNMAHAKPFNPVKCWLEQLVWDGVPRISTALEQVFGVPADDYHQFASAHLFRGAVGRAMEPGAKFDEMVVLYGSQGTHKSTFCAALCPHPSLFVDSLPSLHNGTKAAVEAMKGGWIVEFSELSALKQAGREVVKTFISTQTDTLRLAYAKRATRNQRGCIFIGTSNKDDFLSGSDGNRRFLPVAVDQFGDTIWLHQNRDQLWAEALVSWRNDKATYVPRQLVEVQHAKTLAVSRDYSDMVAAIETYLETPWKESDWMPGVGNVMEGFDEGAETVERTRVCMAEIVENVFMKDVNDLQKTARLRHEIEEAFQHISRCNRGVTQARFRDYGPQRVWWHVNT